MTSKLCKGFHNSPKKCSCLNCAETPFLFIHAVTIVTFWTRKTARWSKRCCIPWAIVERRNVSNLLSDEELLSAAQVDTGMCMKGAIKRFTSEKIVDHTGMSLDNSIKSWRDGWWWPLNHWPHVYYRFQWGCCWRYWQVPKMSLQLVLESVHQWSAVEYGLLQIACHLLHWL